MKRTIIGLLSLLILGFHGPVAGAEDPVVYGISPFYFSRGQVTPALEAIRLRLPELKELGIDVLWLQPITPSVRGKHGYDVTDYKTISPAFGDEADLRRLVQEAHRLGIKVMLDMVVNHSSISHPFVKDVLRSGEASPYHSFYLRRLSTEVPYARFLRSLQVERETLTYYFWQDLVNFDYESPALREFVLDVLVHWVRRFDVDGYRFDASWGPSSRWPPFYKAVASGLRALKPDIILMAEDQAGYPAAYEGTGHPHLKDSGFDWAYDWNTRDPFWISKWSFQVDDSPEATVFNGTDPASSADLFLRAVEDGTPVGGIRPVRYLENNDTAGFLRAHTLEQQVFASKVMFLLPGVPLLFQGQERGNSHEVFQLPSYAPDQKMSASNPGLWSFYRSLIRFRKSRPAFTGGGLRNLRKPSPTAVSFERWSAGGKAEVLVDFGRGEVLVDGEVLKLE